MLDLYAHPQDGLVLWLLEDDNIVNPQTTLAVDDWIQRMRPVKGKVREAGFPIVSGLYYLKGSFAPDLGPEPLMYRGGGTRAFLDWTPGQTVMVDGVPTGCCIIHRNILEAYANEPDMQWMTLPGIPHKVPKIFENPAKLVETAAGAVTVVGTSDLTFCHEVIKRKILAKAGWPELAKKQYPFPVDTSPAMRIGHIDRETGVVHPQTWPTRKPSALRRRRAA